MIIDVKKNGTFHSHHYENRNNNILNVKHPSKSL
jgi:hypothetical protein